MRNEYLLEPALESGRVVMIGGMVVMPVLVLVVVVVGVTVPVPVVRIPALVRAAPGVEASGTCGEEARQHRQHRVGGREVPRGGVPLETAAGER